MEESQVPQEAATQTEAAPKEEKNVLDTALGVGVSLALLFGMVWVISKAWKAGQKTTA